MWECGRTTVAPTRHVLTRKCFRGRCGQHRLQCSRMLGRAALDISRPSLLFVLPPRPAHSVCYRCARLLARCGACFVFLSSVSRFTLVWCHWGHTDNVRSLMRLRRPGCSPRGRCYVELPEPPACAERSVTTRALGCGRWSSPSWGLEFWSAMSAEHRHNR